MSYLEELIRRALACQVTNASGRIAKGYVRKSDERSQNALMISDTDLVLYINNLARSSHASPIWLTRSAPVTPCSVGGVLKAA